MIDIDLSVTKGDKMSEIKREAKRREIQKDQREGERRGTEKEIET